MSLQASCRYYSQGTRSVAKKPSLGLVPTKGGVRLPPPRTGDFTDPTVYHMNRGGKPKTGDDASYERDYAKLYGMSVNDMTNMVMGTPQPTYLPVGSLHMEGGGYVPTYTGRPPKTVLAEVPTKGVDRVPALLQGGEIVIPKKYARIVVSMLKDKHIHLPNC